MRDQDCSSSSETHGRRESPPKYLRDNRSHSRPGRQPSFQWNFGIEESTSAPERMSRIR